MPIFSGIPTSCTGSLFSVFSGSIANEYTASYTNVQDVGPYPCTGSLLIQSYTLSTGSQNNAEHSKGNHGDRLYLFISGSNSSDNGRTPAANPDNDASRWVLLGGASEAWQEGNSTSAINVMTEITHMPDATIFISASTASRYSRYVFPTPRVGLKYTFISNCSASSGVDVWFSAPTANTLTAQVECADGRKSATNKTNLKFLALNASWKLGDRLTAVSDGTSWFVHSTTDARQDDITLD